MPPKKTLLIHVRVSEELLVEIDALGRKMHLGRSSLLRLAWARLIEEEAARDPLRPIATNSEEPQPEG